MPVFALILYYTWQAGQISYNGNSKPQECVIIYEGQFIPPRQVTRKGNLMFNQILLYAGALIISGWGIGHLMPTRNVVTGFGTLSADNRRILMMEWLMEGLTLVFIGLLVAALTALHGHAHAAARDVYRLAALMLLVMAGVSYFTGARTAIVPMRLCPYIKSGVAFLFVLGSVV